MNVTSAYLYTAKNVSAIFGAIQNAQVPPKFTHDFLETLGFKSSGDRAFINVLKGLGFLDANATPTDAYRAYKDKSAAKQVMAEQVRRAYAGLFLADEKAHEASAETLKGKLSTITGKDEAVVEKMATTFKALVALADFASPPLPPAEKPQDERVDSPAMLQRPPAAAGFGFSQVIYINLPTTKDASVYDAIFRSIRDHLL